MAKEAVTREQIRQRILALEKEGKFDTHVDPIDFSLAMPVDSSFHYFPVGPKEHLKRWATMTFGVDPFMVKVANKWEELQVEGRENLKGIKSAIVISNHVQMFDCIALKKAMKGHYTHFVAASFNNMRGQLGDCIRAAGMMPMPNDFLKDLRYFENNIQRALDNHHYVAVYPEQSEWWYYEKPRPFKDGAFAWAVKFNVPVIPCFITFQERKHPDPTPDHMYPLGMTVHILKPIYPTVGANPHAERVRLRDEAFNACKVCYETYYHKPLSYS